MKRFIYICSRLFVFAALAGLTILIWGLIIYGLLSVLSGSANAALPDVYIPQRWTCHTEKPKGEPLRIARGETQVLEITYLAYNQPVNLLSVYDVRLRYRSDDMATGTYHAVTGSVTGTNTVQITWTPAAEAAADRYIFDVLLQGADSASLKAGGTITLTGHITGTVTNVPSIVTGIFDWGGVQHVGITNAPFANAADLLELWQADAAHNAAISNLTDLVGSGVAGVTSNLNEHIAAQEILDAAQDEAIDAAAAGATMGGADITGQSSNAVVIATHGRAFPVANDVPEDMEAMVWDAVLGGMKWGSVDLGSIWSAINGLIANAVSQSYVDAEVSRVEGMVDGNDHVLTLTEDFAAIDWLEIAANVWQHNTYGWLANNAIVVGGDLRLLADIGQIVITTTNHVSKVALTGGASQSLVSHAETGSGPWTGYDTAADNIAYTNRYAIRIWNTGGSQVTVSSVLLYSWTHPERVGATRDFAGLTLRVDTPSGTDAREAANVNYVRTLAATGSISGTFATGFSVDKFKTYPISTAGLLNGMGMIYYSSVNEFRPVDQATQFELDAAVAPLCTIASYNALAARVAATEAGTGVALGGEVGGTVASNRIVKLLGANLPTGPAPAQHSLVMGASGNWELKSVLASNIVYAAGTNDIASVPANSAAFYRADYNGTIVGVFVLDQQVVCWFNAAGLVIPHGNLSLYEQLLESNIHLLDGSLVAPALAFVSEPGMGWHRASSGGEHVWRFGKANNAVVDIGGSGITMAVGKTVTLADGSRAVSLAEIEAGVTEADPYSINESSTTQTWTHVGGTYTSEVLVATSDLLSNGVAAVAYDLAAGAGMLVVVEMSDANGVDWEAFSPFAVPGYVRISLAESLPSLGDLTTTISNITATSWTRPDLVGHAADTAGQIVLVDPAVADRQPVTLAQMQSGLAAVQPSGWSAYPATQRVDLAGNVLLMGEGWTITDNSGLGVISYTDMAASTNGLQLAVNAIPAITATPGFAGLQIATLAVDGGTGTVGVVTNGVTAQPLLQWTASLQAINWQTLTPVSETYPSTNAAGHYEIVAVLPDPAAGFMRAVQPSGDSRVDVHMPLYVLGKPVETGFVRSGTNLLWVLDGVTNRVMMEAWSE